MPFKDRERKLAYDRAFIARQRAAKREQRKRDVDAWYRRQLTDEHDDPPPGVSLEQHQNWCKYVLSLSPIDDIPRGSAAATSCLPT
jgi:hypothetical protein